MPIKEGNNNRKYYTPLQILLYWNASKFQNPIKSMNKQDSKKIIN